MAEPIYRLDDLPALIAEHITIDPVTGCWLHDGPLNGKGYVRIWWNGRMRYAHRVVYTLLARPVPADRPELDHVQALGCRYRNCCWPAHLEPVTHQENMRRALAKTHCPAGHEYPPGPRHCKTCRREKDGWLGGLPMGQRTHCKRGHEFTPENTHIGKSGSRFCLACRKLSYQPASRPLVSASK